MSYLAQVFRLERTITDVVTQETSTEVGYGITSQPATVADAATLLEQVRGEWGVETGLHGRRDTTLREDAGQVRHG